MINSNPSIWRHYKGGLYILHGVACHEAGGTDRELAIYTALDGPQQGATYARPYHEWCATVGDIGKKRFELLVDNVAYFAGWPRL